MFGRHFRALADRYLLIGGTACDRIMSKAGLPFRATKDLDIVLCVEVLDVDFARAFWEFVEAGGYRTMQDAEGKRKFYRFLNPVDDAYPAMLELFSRIPDALSIAEGSYLAPIPISDEVASLSAILLDEQYYTWIQEGRFEMEGLPLVGPAYLVALKARAWLDLWARKQAGEPVDGRAVKKHRNDVFRLFQMIDPEVNVKPPSRVVDDMRSFLAQVAREDVDLKALGLRTITLEEILHRLKILYAAPRDGRL